MSSSSSAEDLDICVQSSEGALNEGRGVAEGIEREGVLRFRGKQPKRLRIQDPTMKQRCTQLNKEVEVRAPGPTIPAL